MAMRDPDGMTGARSRSQQPATNKRSRGMVQNNAMASALEDTTGASSSVGVKAPAQSPSNPTGAPVNASAPVEAPSAPSAPSTPNPSGAGSHWDAEYRFLGGEGLPNVNALSYGDTSRLSGFNTAAWGTGARGENTIKNTVGKLMTRVDPTSPGARDALMAQPEFKTLFPHAKAVSYDKIDFGDGRPVDVLVAADPTSGAGTTWAWQTMDAPAAAPLGAIAAPLGPLTSTLNPGAFVPAGGGDDRVRQLIQYLMSQLAMDKALG